MSALLVDLLLEFRKWNFCLGISCISWEFQGTYEIVLHNELQQPRVLIWQVLLPFLTNSGAKHKIQDLRHATNYFSTLQKLSTLIIITYFIKNFAINILTSKRKILRGLHFKHRLFLKIKEWKRKNVFNYRFNRRESENEVQRKKNIIRGRNKLRNDEIHTQYSSTKLISKTWAVSDL